MSNDGHSQWNILASVLIDSGKYFDVNACIFTNELSVVKLCEQPALHDYLRKWLSKLNQKKERTLALTNKYRVKGNKYFDEFTEHNDLSMDYYTKAIFNAPKDSVELGLAHGFRAGCLMNCDRFYEEGYFDCKLALKFNYPRARLPKLFERKLRLANRTQKREEYITETYQEMQRMRVQLTKDNISIRDDHQAKRIMRDFNNANRWKDDLNKTLKNKKLTEKSNSSVGRFLITEEAIEENEPVYCEKAFSFVPAYTFDQMDVISYACQNCAKINCLPFPCYSCARVTYCSPACLAKHEPIHKYECAGYQKNLWVKLGIGYLAFRTCIVGFQTLVEILKKGKASTLEEAWSILMLDCHKEEFSYGRVLRLASHIDKVSPRKILRFALTAHLVIIYLSEYTDFFKNLPPICGKIMANAKDWKTLMTAILLKHMGQAYFNSQTPTHLQLLPPSMYRKSYGYGSYHIHLDDLHLVLFSGVVFSAFYPRVSMANHSCDPNIRFNVNGLTLYAYASRNIGQHEEILTCYGPHYKLSSTVERKSQLDAEFYFTCKCNRCVSNDTSYLKYYEYYCPNEECNSLVELDGIDMRWWYYLNTDYCDRLDGKFRCDECGEKLPMNPSMLRKFELAAQGHIDKGYTFHSTDSFVITSNLLNLYFNVSKCMGKYHELKARLAHMVLGYCILDADVKLFPRLAYITMENYVNRVERYGMYTLESILVAAYALSILTMAQRIEWTNTLPAMARDIAKIRKILSLKSIEKSLVILPPSMQIVFRHHIHNLDFDAPSVDELDIEHMNIGDGIKVSGSVSTGSNSEKTVG